MKPAILVENAPDLFGDGNRALFPVELHLETGDASFDGPRSPLHPLVDQQKVPAIAGGKQRGAEREAIDFAFDFDLASQPPDFGGIER
jgi:hypothetical protein